MALSSPPVWAMASRSSMLKGLGPAMACALGGSGALVGDVGGVGRALGALAGRLGMPLYWPPLPEHGGW